MSERTNKEEWLKHPEREQQLGERMGGFAVTLQQTTNALYLRQFGIDTLIDRQTSGTREWWEIE